VTRRRGIKSGVRELFSGSPQANVEKTSLLRGYPRRR
jgi:hypothetical protein